MTKRKRTQKEIIRLALQLAIEWEKSLADCIKDSKDDAEYRQYCLDNIAAFKALLDKKYA